MLEEFTAEQWDLIGEAVEFHLQHLMESAELNLSAEHVTHAFRVMKLHGLLRDARLGTKSSAAVIPSTEKQTREVPEDELSDLLKPEIDLNKTKNKPPKRVTIDTWNGYEINFSKKEIYIWQGNWREGGSCTFAFDKVNTSRFKDCLDGACIHGKHEKHLASILAEIGQN